MKTTSFFFICAVVAVLVAAVPTCFSADRQYESCRLPLRCGEDSTQLLPSISYPFWGVNRPSFCGQQEFQLFCKNDQNLTLELDDNVPFRVLSFDLENQTLTVAEESLFMGMCPNLTLNFTGTNPFTLSPLAAEMIDLFVCPSSSPPKVDPSSFTCGISNTSLVTYYATWDRFLTIECIKVGEVPVIGSAYGDFQQSKITLEQVFKKGFKLSYKTNDNRLCGGCMSSGGICSSETGSERFRCLCPDKPHMSSCNDESGSTNWSLKIFIGGAAGLIGVLIAIAATFLYKRKQNTEAFVPHNIKALIPLKQYSYAQVKKITKSFTHEVGKGGFGTVYRGNLCDGRVVAVKVLKESKGNGEDFINEVASMSKTSHVNIVTLLGFCYEGSKRAIIYEFLENGSLDKFISSKKSSSVDLNALYGIALGVARGLEYLHNGCRTRIVHFDIKPQNVLLDDNLCPKVSDFGLAKLCENKGSILSLMDTRGTIGYIAPEVFSRMYGRVSHKSDVYSYGMLVLEMIGARNKTSTEDSASNPSSMYFPDWIYKDLEKADNKRLTEDGISSEEEEIAKKMTLVGLWCIQPSPSDRPSMNRVVEMMEGSMDALAVPPKPVLQFSLVPHAESSWISDENSVPSEALSNP